MIHVYTKWVAWGLAALFVAVVAGFGVAMMG
jgi:hypothetical protein